MAYQAILVVLLASVIALSSAVGCVPAVPTADGSVNPVSYNALASSFSLNGPNTTAFDSSLLNLVVQWNDTANRTLKWIGIGSGNECSNNINNKNSAPTTYGWVIGAAADNCSVSATASYIWPQAFYDTNCASQFQITQQTADNTQTLTFLIYVQYEDCVSLERNGISFVQCQNITTELPVQIIFPTFTQVSTLLPIGVFSKSSINITAALASQTLTLSNPALSPTATFTFVTYVGESFQLDPASGITGPVTDVKIVESSNQVTYPTRQQLWTVTVTLGTGACNINGVYSTNFTIFYTAVNGSGTLPPDQNPIPNNASAVVNFTIVSADFCAQFNRPTISAVLYPFLLNTTNYFDNFNTVPPHRGFLTGDVIYLAAHVTSDFLPILTTTITKVYTSTSDAPTFVVLDTTNALLEYGTAVGGVDSKSSVVYPRPDAVAWFVLDPTIFVVDGDRNVQYNFQVDITVTFNNNGQKREVTYKRQAIAPRQAGAPSQATRASTFALIAPGAVSSALSVSANFVAVCAAVLAACLLM